MQHETAEGNIQPDVSSQEVHFNCLCMSFTACVLEKHLSLFSMLLQMRLMMTKDIAQSLMRWLKSSVKSALSLLMLVVMMIKICQQQSRHWLCHVRAVQINIKIFSF